jgi:integrase
MDEVLTIYGAHRPKTRAKMRQVLREIGETVDDNGKRLVRRTSDLRPVVIAHWKAAHEDRSPATVHSLLRSFVTACAIGVESGYFRASPVGRLSRWAKLPKKGKTKLAIPPDQLNAFLDRLDEEASRGGFIERRTCALGYTYAYTGMRKLEALGLRWEDADLRANPPKVRIVGHATRPLKTDDSEGELALHPILARILVQWRAWLHRSGNEWLRSTPWIFPNVNGAGKGWWEAGPVGHKPLDRIKAVGERCGVNNLTIAAFRKTIGTFARRWDLTPEEIRDWFRHTRLETQQWYDEGDAEFTQQRLKQIADKLSFRVATA